MSSLSPWSTLLSLVVLVVCLVGSGNGRSLSNTNTTPTNTSLLNLTKESSKEPTTIVLSEHDIKGNQYFEEDETMSHEVKEEEVEVKQKSKSSSKHIPWAWIAPSIVMTIILTVSIALVVRKHSHYGRPGPSRRSRYQPVAPIEQMALPNYNYSQEIIVVDVQPYYADPATMSHA